MNNFLSLRDVANKLGVNIVTVRRLITDDKLIAHKVGGRSIRIYEEDLNSFIKGTVMNGSVKQKTEENKE